MPPLQGILETALYVADLERSLRFYREVFELEILSRDEGFCALNVAGRQVLLLFQQGMFHAARPVPGGIIPGHDGGGRLHFAFAIAAADLDGWRERLQRHGIPIESTVVWPRAGHSLYFRDPDGHLGELATPGIWSIY